MSNKTLYEQVAELNKAAQELKRQIGLQIMRDKRKIINLYYWLDLLFWFAWRMVIHAIRFDLDGCIDSIYWIGIHLNYSSTSISPGNSKQPLEVKLTTLLGLLISLLLAAGVIYATYKAVNLLLTLILYYHALYR